MGDSEQVMGLRRVSHNSRRVQNANRRPMPRAATAPALPRAVCEEAIRIPPSETSAMRKKCSTLP